ncbi:hypothetical protein ACFVXG_22120 [Kitasatospora sp. NPDC058162]|uniref:hypothetical protein n=1 Tax=Kitasatospora sp. NPDC058162 TaxID=3346362 RepID=UPI0036DC8F8D
MTDSIDPRTPGPVLGQLIGVPFGFLGRIGYTGLVGFGRDLSWTVPGSSDTATGSELALHIECPFRIVQHGRIFVGSDDMVPTRRGNPPKGEDERLQFDTGAEALQEYLDRMAPKVLTVERAPEGDLRIMMEHGIRVDILPTSSKRKESWRFLVRFGEHVVFPPSEN